MSSIVRSIVKGMIFGNAVGTMLYIGPMYDGMYASAYIILPMVVYVVLWCRDVGLSTQGGS